jgi:hypothetical protein
MAESNILQAITMAVYDTAGLAAAYAPLNGGGFSGDIKVLKIYNASNTPITISYDGVTDEDFYPATNGFILDIQSNHSSGGMSSPGKWRGKKGQIIYGKGAAGVGSLYIVGYF